jgi:predicted nucleic acid-binding Zn ribbon protein
VSIPFDPSQGRGPTSGPGSGLKRPAPTGDVLPPRRRAATNEIDDEPSAADIERFRHATTRCPHCKKEVFDDVDICYHCNMAMTKEQKPPKPWIVITVVVLLFVFAFVLLGLRF